MKISGSEVFYAKKKSDVEEEDCLPCCEKHKKPSSVRHAKPKKGEK